MAPQPPSRMPSGNLDAAGLSFMQPRAPTKTSIVKGKGLSDRSDSHFRDHALATRRSKPFADVGGMIEGGK